MSRRDRQRYRAVRSTYIFVVIVLLVVVLVETGWIVVGSGQPSSFLTYGAVHTFPPNSFLLNNVPDTFDYHDSWTSTAPVTVYYLTIEQFTEYHGCKASTTPIKCVSGNFTSIGPTKNSNDVFTLAEGCGDYVVVYEFGAVGGTFYPSVMVTYKPSTILTGVCSRTNSSS